MVKFSVYLNRHVFVMYFRVGLNKRIRIRLQPRSMVWALDVLVHDVMYRIFPKYPNTLTPYHTWLKISTSSFYFLLIDLFKTAR